MLWRFSFEPEPRRRSGPRASVESSFLVPSTEKSAGGPFDFTAAVKA